MERDTIGNYAQMRGTTAALQNLKSQYLELKYTIWKEAIADEKKTKKSNCESIIFTIPKPTAITMAAFMKLPAPRITLMYFMITVVILFESVNNLHLFLLLNQAQAECNGSHVVL